MGILLKNSVIVLSLVFPGAAYISPQRPGVGIHLNGAKRNLSSGSLILQIPNERPAGIRRMTDVKSEPAANVNEDGLAGGNLISLNDDVLPLDSQAKVIADQLAVDIAEEIKYTKPFSVNKEISIDRIEKKTAHEKEIVVPKKRRQDISISKIIKFAIPATGVWLCGPILSLIDTASVGLLAGTMQQAGLSPGVAICDYSALLMAFLYTATTNLVAVAQQQEGDSDSKPRATCTLISALQLSGYVGFALGTFLILFSKPLIMGIMGTEAVDPIVFNAARKYVNIRALGFPAAAIIGSAQSACLGMRDIRSPLYVLMAAAAVNFFGDVLFVGRSAAWLGGAAGAAWATVFSQYAALFFFIKWLTHKRAERHAIPPELQSGSEIDAAKRLKVTKKILRLASSSSAAFEMKRHRLRSALAKMHLSIQGETNENKNLGRKFLKPLFGRQKKNKNIGKEKSFSAKGFLSGKFHPKQLLRFPDKSMVNEFTPYVIPVTITSVGRISVYVAMANVVASSLGTLSMAAQQIITSVFYSLTPIADSLSLTAQSFIPSIFERSKTKDGAKDLRDSSLNFIKAGGIFGGFMALIVSCMPLIADFFTTDYKVINVVNSVVPTLVAIFTTHGIVCASEGVLLGQKDLNLLGRAYGVFFFAMPYFMFNLKKAASMGAEVTLASLWQVFLKYNIFRACFFTSRIAYLSYRKRKSAVDP